MPVSDKLKGLRAAVDDDTDFTIKVDAYNIRVHSDVMAAASPFFKKVIDKDGPWQESKERMIELSTDAPSMVARMIQYCYTNDYSYAHGHASSGKHVSIDDLLDLGKSCQPTCDDPISNNGTSYPKSFAWIDLNMYVLGDKYGMLSLQAHSLCCFKAKYVGMDTLFEMKMDPAICQLLGENSELTKAFAYRIARLYKHIHTTPSMENARQRFRAWLKESPDLWIMVMDELCED